jgi:bifunctional polynucleotide phosphatase/kinase
MRFFTFLFFPFLSSRMSYYVFPGSTSKKQIALFDVDGTLVISKSGRRWAASESDWIFLGPSIPSVLNKFHQDGWTVALVSNQSDWTKSDEAHKKMESILSALESANGWRPWCLVATAPIKQKKTDLYRKPQRGLYDVLLNSLHWSADQVTEVFMCGDAVGSSDPFPPYRWASSDKEFADAIGASFRRPCDVFSGSSLPSLPSHKSHQELILLVGNPGSGKSTSGRRFASEYNYAHVEQDLFKTKSVVKKEVERLLKEGRSVVVDATHGNKDNRSPYIALASFLHIPCRVLWHIRDGRGFNETRQSPVPEIAYAIYSKHFTEPSSEEGEVAIVV